MGGVHDPSKKKKENKLPVFDPQHRRVGMLSRARQMISGNLQVGLGSLNKRARGVLGEQVCYVRVFVLSAGIGQERSVRKKGRKGAAKIHALAKHSGVAPRGANSFIFLWPLFLLEKKTLHRN